MPPPARSQVDIWRVALDTPGAPILSAGEQTQAARFHFERDRLRWSRARSALRVILANYLETDPLALHFHFGPFGKPSLRGGVHFNISHSDAWGMIAVTRAGPVGIDIELIRDNVDIAALLRRIGERVGPDTVPNLFRVWARREARTKALGGPLMEIPAGDLRVVDLEAPAGFAAALALVGCDPQVQYRNIQTL